MKSSLQVAQLSSEALAVEFFQQSAGNWHSQRRYYSLNNGEVQEVVSSLSIEFLDRNSPHLCQLSQLHSLDDKTALIGGAKVAWQSHYVGPSRKPSTGSTVFGLKGTTLYRDRGFATNQPIIAQFYCPHPRTLCLRTEYAGSLFEEELKLIGTNYRTRQTIISRAGQEQTIGQYLEKRICA